MSSEEERYWQIYDSYYSQLIKLTENVSLFLQGRPSISQVVNYWRNLVARFYNLLNSAKKAGLRERELTQLRELAGSYLEGTADSFAEYFKEFLLAYAKRVIGFKGEDFISEQM